MKLAGNAVGERVLKMDGKFVFSAISGFQIVNFCYPEPQLCHPEPQFCHPESQFCHPELDSGSLENERVPLWIQSS